MDIRNETEQFSLLSHVKLMIMVIKLLFFHWCRGDPFLSLTKPDLSPDFVFSAVPKIGPGDMAHNVIMITIFTSLDIDNYHDKCQIIISLNVNVWFLFPSSWINLGLGDVGEIDITIAIGTFSQ